MSNGIWHGTTDEVTLPCLDMSPAILVKGDPGVTYVVSLKSTYVLYILSGDFIEYFSNDVRTGEMMELS